MNIQELNQLIPIPYRDINVSTTFLYYRDGAVYPISGSYTPLDSDFIFKYKKTNGVLNIEEVKYSELPKITWSAEEWVQKYFTSMEIIALTRLEQSIIMQGKSLGPKMQSVKEWLEGMMFAQPSNNFGPSPYTYSETSIEAANTLAL